MRSRTARISIAALIVADLSACSSGRSSNGPADAPVVMPTIDAPMGSVDGAPDGSPDAAVPVEGMSWPASQVFPSFAPITALDVIDDVNRPGDVPCDPPAVE